MRLGPRAVLGVTRRGHTYKRASCTCRGERGGGASVLGMNSATVQWYMGIKEKQKGRLVARATIYFFL